MGGVLSAARSKGSLVFLAKCWARLLSQGFLTSAPGTRRKEWHPAGWSLPPPPLCQHQGTFQDLRGDSGFRTSGTLMVSIAFSLLEFQAPCATEYHAQALPVPSHGLSSAPSR